MFEDFPVISTYTVDQAIEDGSLFEVTKIAKEAGFKCRVFMAQELHSDMTPSNEVKDRYAVDYEGRLWDAVWMASLAARKNRSESVVYYDVILQTNVCGSPLSKHHVKKIMMVADGNGVTLMYPHEY